MSEQRSGFIALIGRPNAGKSTLLNNLVGEKVAITSDKPQTTRNRIVGILNGENWQIIFLDTPGIHKPHDRLGENMVKTAMSTLRDVDVIYYLVDTTVPFGGGDAYVIEKLKKIATPVFLLLNKIDRLDKSTLLPLINFYKDKMAWTEVFPVSALKGENLDILVQTTQAYLTPGPRYYPSDTVTDQTEHMLITELIREKVLRHTREEIPHSVAVNLDIMEKRSEELLYIGATIYTERDSQKGILIGKKGEMLKRIGSGARKDIEKLTGNRVFLELWVKTKADWRNKDKFLHDLGYSVDTAGET